MVAEIFIVAFFLFLFTLGALGTIFWILMIVDCARRKFKNSNDRVLWILVLVLAGVIGAFIYYFVIKKPNKH